MVAPRTPEEGTAANRVHEGSSIEDRVGPRFFFGIPFRSRAAANNWRRVCRLLDATLASVLQQNDPDLEILVACHEIPKLSTRDPRVSFLFAPHATPRDRLEQMFDKRAKKIMLAEETCRKGGGYLMLLDSDDLVSKRLTEFVRTHDNKRGYVVSHGFSYDFRSRRLVPMDDFDRVCGSSVIVYLSSDDCEDNEFDWREYVGDTWHADFRRRAAELLRPLDELPFPAAIYVRNTGQNHSVASTDAISMIRAEAAGTRRRAGDWGRRLPKVPRELAEEFGLQVLGRNSMRYSG